MDEILRKAFAAVDTVPTILGDEPFVAALLDEEDPHGPVALHDKSGNVRVLMPKDVWDSLRED